MNKEGVEPQGVTMKILIADDEEMIRELVHASLSGDSNLHMVFARDGQEAVTLANAERPELIILDVRMPRMDGYEACRAIRNEATAHRPTILMLTAMGQESDVQRGLDAGADDYFIKPFSPAQLLSKVYALLDVAA